MYMPPADPTVWEILILLLHIALAGSVTIDALLKKSDVRAALGWVALAWFSPVVGALLYFLFGINRVSRRALKLRRHDDGRTGAGGGGPAPDGHIAKLEQVSARVTNEPLTAGNALSVLEGGDSAYPAMLEAIAGAKRSIVMASYIFRADAAGRRFCDALIAAHKRGVQVRVLLDGIGAGYILCPARRVLRAGGVPTALFLHSWWPWRMPFLNMRNHRKLLVVDGSLGFVGGINIGSENCSGPSRRRPIHDVHFRVRGPVVRALMDTFARDWSFITGESLDTDCWWPKLERHGQVFARGLRSGPDADLYKLESILGAALTLAKERIRIVTPYFLPDARLQFVMRQACLRGVKFEVLLPRVSDQRIMDWAMRGHLRFFRHMSIAFFTSPPPFDHTKLCTVDGRWALIGSSNWDARSFRLNFELDLECIDEAFTAELDRLIDARLARARPLSPDALAAEPVWLRLRNAAARLLMPYL
jgi:cardiolipin synthase